MGTAGTKKPSEEGLGVTFAWWGGSGGLFYGLVEDQPGLLPCTFMLLFKTPDDLPGGRCQGGVDGNEAGEAPKSLQGVGGEWTPGEGVRGVCCSKTLLFFREGPKKLADGEICTWETLKSFLRLPRMDDENAFLTPALPVANNLQKFLVAVFVHALPHVHRKVDVLDCLAPTSPRLEPKDHRRGVSRQRFLV